MCLPFDKSPTIYTHNGDHNAPSDYVIREGPKWDPRWSTLGEWFGSRMSRVKREKARARKRKMKKHHKRFR